MFDLVRVLVAPLALAVASHGTTSWIRPTGEHVQVPGTQLLLEAPPGFTPAARFSGLESVETGASVIVMEIPGPYGEVVKAMTEENLKRGGVKLLERTEVDVAGRRGVLLRATQSAGGSTYFKWIAVFGDESRTIQVAANYPQEVADRVGDPLRSCVLGTKWDHTLVVDPFAFLPFTITVPSELKFFMRMQNGLAFTRTGEANKGAPTEPQYMVQPSLAAAKIDDLEKFANARLRQMPSLRDLEVESSQAIEIGGLKAWEIVALGKHDSSGTPLVRYFVMLLDGEGYYIASGDVGAQQRDTYLPVFRLATASFKLKPAEKK